MRHMGSQKACWACFFKMDTTSQLIGGSFARRSSLLLSHSHQEDTFEKNLLHFMPCHAIIAGLGDTFRACGELERSQINRGWTQFGDARQIENGPRRLESISQRWRHTCNGCCATHARSRAVVSSFVGLFGVSMNHRRKMTFIAGSKSALVGWLTNLLGNRWIHWWYGVHRLVFVGDWTLLIAITSLGCPSNFATCLTALVINYCWHLRMNPWNAVFISEGVEFYIFY